MISFLIDECLTPKLVAAAHARGYAAAHVAYLQRTGTMDWLIAQIALQRDAILVTNNAKDFIKLYSRFDVHPGLLIILPRLSRAEQIQRFEQAISFIEEKGDITNRLVEMHAAGTVTLRNWSIDEV